MADGDTVGDDGSNTEHEARVATLVWNDARRVVETSRSDGEVVITRDGEGRPEPGGRYGSGYDGSDGLAFTAVT